MRYFVFAFACAATPLGAESFCGMQDAEAVLARLDNIWQLDGAVSVETETLSLLEEESGIVVISGGLVDAPAVRRFTDAIVAPEIGRIYDVDGVDDILAAVEAEWIADAVSATPCGPEDLPQLSATFARGAEVSGRITLVPYFTDQVVMIVEAELTGDWGLAFLTQAALLVPGAP